MAILDAKSTNPREGGPSFSLGHRMLRFVWNIAWVIFGKYTPVPLHGWRRFLLRCFGARIDGTAKVYPGVRIWYPQNLVMGKHACLARDVNCYCMGRISLGAYALVSQGAHLCAGTHDIDNPHFQLVIRPIVIDEYAWVASEAFVGPGVEIGRGAVLGARSVAFKNLETMSVYVGNPARFIRYRIEQSI